MCGNALVLTKEHTTKVQCGGRLLALCEGEDGSLHIEANGCGRLEVSVEDNGGKKEAIQGTWAWINVGLLPSPRR